MDNRKETRVCILRGRSPSEQRPKHVPWKDQNGSQRFTTVSAFLIVVAMFFGPVFLIAGRTGCVIVASLAPLLWLAKLPKDHPLKTGLRLAGRIFGFILKWLIYIGFTAWACARYGWIGFFAVPLAKGVLDFSKAVDNWKDHWSKEPRNKK